MSPLTKNIKTTTSVEALSENLPIGDINDLCDCTDAAIEAGGGFGWIKPPMRDSLVNYWQGIITMPSRTLFVARLDGVICGAAVLTRPQKNNEAQRFAAKISSVFVAPWARQYGLANELMQKAETMAKEEGYEIINLDVRETQTEAIKLYESRNYVYIGTHPFYAKVQGDIIKGYYYYKVINPQKTSDES